MKKVKKGDYGYIRSEKVRRTLKSALFLALPLAFFIFGLIINHGDKKTIYSVVAVVGCIPACISIVSMLMMLMRHPMERALYEEVDARAGDLTMAYELFLTTYEKNLFLDATAIGGDYLIAYTSDQKIRQADVTKMEEHVANVMKVNGYRTNVKIYMQKKAFLERMDAMNNKLSDYRAAANEHFIPYEKYPDLTREEVVKHLLMAVSL